MKLIRFWFKFKNDEKLTAAVRMGCGVTAFHLDDAKKILSEKVFKNEPYEIEECKENIDVSTLDANHILTNMHPPSVRAVWFSMSYT